MMNQYPIWKYSLLVCIIFFGSLYALPNLFGEDPAIQITATRTAAKVDTQQDRIVKALDAANIKPKAVQSKNDSALLVRFNDVNEQYKAQAVIKETLGRDYTIALNLAPSTPDWLRSLGALPMYLGLDLRGGVHFLIEVDMKAAIKQAEERYQGDIRQFSQGKRKEYRYRTITRSDKGIAVKFSKLKDRDLAYEQMRDEFRILEHKMVDTGDEHFIMITLTDSEKKTVKTNALQQNITTLRNRVNELGVAEPIIQQQGDERIVVQLPGIQDSALAKELLGKTATLEFRLVDYEHDVSTAVNGRVPPNSKLYKRREGGHALLKKRIIVTGENVTGAKAGIEQQSGTSAVFINLDGPGSKKMTRVSAANINKPMGVVFIEYKEEERKDKNGKPILDANGKPLRKKWIEEEVINIATIRDVLSKRFQISGLDNTKEAANLALLLRAGSLAAPIYIIEERTVGPTLGAQNIRQGFYSVVIGLIFVIIFMASYYRVFGLIANLALIFNIVLIVAVLSMLQATLTLPGIAGIVLTVGMAVDANVLIFERIREEIRNGSSPQASIHSGYEKAFSTIADANVTTLIAAVVLLSFGTGPIKGFAVTLSIGIVTSMFTAILGTRAIVNLIYGGRKAAKLSI